MQFSMKECEIYLKDAFVQFKKERYKCVSLSEFINLWPFLAPGSLECYSKIKKLQFLKDEI